MAQALALNAQLADKSVGRDSDEIRRFLT